MGIMADQAMARLRRVEAAQTGALPEPRPVLRERGASIARVAIIVAAFAVLASASFLIRPNTDMTARVPDKTQKYGAPTGRAAFPLGDGRTCRELVFDRTKGDIVDSNTAPCDSIARKAYIEPERPGASNGFIWGRK